MSISLSACAAVLCLAALGGLCLPAAAHPTGRVGIIIGRRATEPERQAAGVLAARLTRADLPAEVAVETGSSLAVDLNILLGLPANHDRLAAACREHGLAVPTAGDPGPEGFALRTVSDAGGGRLILAAGVDARGVLYAVGELLRQLTPAEGGLTVPEVDVRTAPAYRWRGASANRGGTMAGITGAREWTTEELHDYALDLALAGANTFYASGEFRRWLKSFGLLTEAGFRPNEWRGKTPYPKEWQATERGNWVCPSVPAARKALLAQWEQVFAGHEGADVMRLFAGDPGGCRCPKCAPWGKTFIRLCEDMAKLWLKHHPDSVVQIANQDLDNAGDRAIFDYLNEKPHPWLYAICYGPGSNAMSDYFRAELRDDLFTYPGPGPVSRYLQEILHNLPAGQRIVHYSDITHWISSQYQVEHPEPHLVAVYGRRTFHTRPEAYYRIFQAVMPFSEGDIIYSEGYHDELHQYLWQRLLWDPHRSLDDVLMEYACLHFGPAAAPEMVAAMRQLERNLELPLATNDGIDRYYLLVKSAGWKMPPALMQASHRWRLHMQHAALDKYLQEKLRRQTSQQARAQAALERGLTAEAEAALTRAAAILAEPAETPDMAALRAEAGRLGEESDKLYGVRDVGYFRLDQDLVGSDWLRAQVARLQAAPAAERPGGLESLLRYEDPGPGGFYDCALPGRHPHLVQGETTSASQWLDPANRPSQNALAYSLGEGPGVVFRYTGLDPQARYRVRLTVVAPRFPQAADLPGAAKPRQHVLADGTYVVKDLAVPIYTARQVELDLPAATTVDGTLELAFEKAQGGLGTVVSEVWLLRAP